VARFYPYADSADALFRPAKGLTAASYFQDWSEGDAAEPHVLCAEMSRLAYAPAEVVEPALRRIDWSLVRPWLGGERLADRVASWGSNGFVARSADGRVVVAFRGTEPTKPENLLVDLLTGQTDSPAGGRVHRGFAYAFGRVRSALAAAVAAAGPGPLLITGHSLGAGLATLAAMHLRSRRPRLITFGSPRVGDGRFCELLTSHQIGGARFVNCCDLVPRIPPEQFDGPHVERLLADLAVAPGIARAVARALCAMLAAASVAPRFADVCGASYVRGDGVVVERCSVDDVARDRTNARRTYRAQHPGLTLSTVPFRDLADHAPINYLSAMVRHFRPADARPMDTGPASQ
jgi:Lipase (class 3)